MQKQVNFVKGWLKRVIGTKESQATGPTLLANINQAKKRDNQSAVHKSLNLIVQTFNEEDETCYDQIINNLTRLETFLKICKDNANFLERPQEDLEWNTLICINKILSQEAISLQRLQMYLASKSDELQMENQMQQKPKGKIRQRDVRLIHCNFSNGLLYQYYPVRALMWKIAIGYLPCRKQKWISIMQTNLVRYQEKVRMYIIEPLLKKRGIGKQQKEEQIKDHPLNHKKHSKWQNYFQDYSLWNKIERDTSRTGMGSKFFQLQHDFQQGVPEGELSSKQLHLSKIERQQTYYYDALTRILFIYFKTHPETTYIQGVNEIVAVIYYAFTNKNSEYFRRVSESDSYFVFQIVMEQLIQSNPKHFQSSAKYSQLFERMLRKVDYRLCEVLLSEGHCDTLKMVTARWFIVGFLTEFGLDKGLILWDAVIVTCAHENTVCGNLSCVQFMLYIGLAIIHLHRTKILEGQNILTLLTKISKKPEQILSKASHLYSMFPNILRNLL